jgi:Right handed beta helix region
MRSMSKHLFPTVGGRTSRREVLRRGAALAAVSVIAPMWTRIAKAQSAASFDYYISTTGSDANPGTLASPWAITSFQSSSPNNALMKSKRIGILPGTYGVYSLWKGASYNKPALNFPSGTSAAPTYIGSSDAKGLYSPRTALITASPSGIPGGGLPGTSADSIAIAGISYADAGGYVTVDGLVISDSQGYGIWFQGPTSTQGGPPYQVVNCEIYNIGGTEGNNPGCIMFIFAAGCLVQNCKLHDCQVGSNPGDHNFAGIFSFNCSSNIYEYNTIYNCNSGIYDKNPNNGGHTYRYNYIEVNGTHPASAIQDSAGDVAGQVHTAHHNIMVVAAGANGWVGADINQLSYGSFVVYNNTVHALSGSLQGGIMLQTRGTAVSPAATVKHYNNVYDFSTSPGYLGDATFSSSVGAIALSDYNCFQSSGASVGSVGVGTYGSSALQALPNWQSSMSLDGHSIAATPSFTNPGVALTPSGYQLQSGSPCLGTGRIGGVSTGAACNMGAWDGTVTQIGCNFAAGATGNSTALPDPPALTVS